MTGRTVLMEISLLEAAHLTDLVAQFAELLDTTLDTDPRTDPALARLVPDAYADDATASGGSNLAPTSTALVERVRGDVAAMGGKPGSVPTDLVTTSGSGLDPDISPAAAEAQVARVAKARHLPADRVHALVRAAAQGRQAGLLGEPRVNVLKLNLALDATK